MQLKLSPLFGVLVLTIMPIPPESTALASNSASVFRSIAHCGWSEHHLTLPGSTPDAAWFRQLDTLLGDSDTTILGVTLFGDEQALHSMGDQIRCRGIDAPQTAILSNSATPGGIQIDTASGICATPLFENGRLIGSYFEDSEARYCILNDLRPTTPALSRGAQTEAVLQTIQESLVKVGMDFRDVVRTWFYVDRILDWYGEFNQVRTTFFQEHGITRMPASTGVGAPNLAGAALVARVIAVQPKSAAVTVNLAESPLQCEALAYGSSFSRAMEVAGSGARSLYISGTASIEPEGATVFADNAVRQIEKTMEVVEAILKHSRMCLADITRAIAYFRHPEQTVLWNEYCQSRQLPPLPVIVAQCDICRDDLLFELELDAVRAL